MRSSLKQFFVVAIVVMVATLTIETNKLKHRSQQLLVASTELYDKVVLMEAVYDSVYRRHLDEAFVFAPKGKSLYQLRGDAQTRAQELLNLLTTKHKLPTYTLPGIRFRGALPRGAAGTATVCENPNRIISLNEILYYRNYNEFIYSVIPHEVAHVFTCITGGYVGDEHGEEWESAMIDMHFLNPDDEKTHELDMNPVYRYQLDLSESMGEIDF